MYTTALLLGTVNLCPRFVGCLDSLEQIIITVWFSGNLNKFYTSRTCPGWIFVLIWIGLVGVISKGGGGGGRECLC